MSKINSIKTKNITLDNTSTKICVPITSTNETQLIRDCASIEDCKPDMIEWRADYFSDLSTNSILKALDIITTKLQEMPVIFTLRNKEEGGNAIISQQLRMEIITNVILSKKIQFVDIEYNNQQEFKNKIKSVAKENNVFIIFSNHNFKATPKKDEIIKTLLDMQNENCDIAKIAYMPTSLNDVLVLLDATVTFNREFAKIPIISISMGKLGVVSRIASEIFGSSITFAKMGDSTASGQIPINELKSILSVIKNV